MNETRTAYRYALSLLEVAEEFKALDSVGADVDHLESVLMRSPEFRQFVRSPIIRMLKKRAVMGELFRGRTSDVTYKFLLLVVAKNRASILPEIVSEFKKLRDERLGILPVTVRSAVALEAGEEKELIAHLERVTKKHPRLKASVDASLIGGLTLRYGDTVWDGSVRCQLESLRQRLIEGNV